MGAHSDIWDNGFATATSPGKGAPRCYHAITLDLIKIAATA